MKLLPSTDIINLTKQTFSKEFLKISPELNELSEILWFMFKAGGSAPIDIISARSPNFSNIMILLEEAGVIESKRELVLFNEKFEEELISRGLAKLTMEDIKSVLLNNYYDKLTNRLSFTGLKNSLAIVLSSVILSTGPNQPAILSKILRTCYSFLGDTGKIMENVMGGGPELILDYYLNKNLGLVKIGNNQITLTEKAEKLIRKNQFLWEIYTGKERTKKSKKK